MQVSTELLASQFDKVYGADNGVYDANKWFVGKGINYKVVDGTPVLTPMFEVIRPMEESTAFAVGFPQMLQKNGNEWYMFVAETTLAATTRRIRLYTLNVKNGSVTSNGFITLTKPVAGNGTLRDYKVDLLQYSTGTVAVSGAAVTGTGTLFQGSRIAVGSRIGFGSTDPTQITQWYFINAISSETACTIQVNTTAAGTGGAAASLSLPSNTPYVIQDFRQLIDETNATTTNGGLFLAKGVAIEDFTIAGTTIAAAVTTDNVKACYWLKDATTQTNIVSCGMVIRNQVSITERDVIVMDSPLAANYKFYRYNIRAALTLTAGAATTPFVLATGNNAVTGTIAQVASCCLATANHGSGIGVESIYAVTTTRVLRIPISNITSGNTSCVVDSIIETTPSGASTFSITNGMSSIEYSTTLDRFYITTTSAWTYLTRFLPSGTQFDRLFGRVIGNLDQPAASPNFPRPFFAPNGTVSTLCSITGTGLVVYCKNGTATSTQQIYILAAGADKDFAIDLNCVVISPKITISNIDKFLRAFILENRFLGANEGMVGTEPFLVYFRTANIDVDMTTGWQLLDKTDNLSAFTGATECQLRIVFQTLGITNLPAQIIGVGLTYNDYNTTEKWAFSDEKSVAASKQFAFRQVSQYGTDYPTLNIRLVNNTTGAVILTDDSVAQAQGTWEKSTDGTTWGAYNDTDRASGTGGDNTYIRFTPTAAISGKVGVSLY